MKRIVSAALCVAVLLFTFAYAETGMDSSLIAKARETASVMHELACTDNLTSMYTGSADMLSSIHEIAAYDFENPESAVVVTISDDCISEVITEMGIDAPADSALFRAIKDKLYNALPSMLNGRFGANWLALTSILSVSDAYSPEAPYGGIAYVLLRYAGEQPDIACAFNMNGSSAAVTASYLDASALDAVDWSVGAKAILKSFFGTEIPIDLSGIAITDYSAEAIR